LGKYRSKLQIISDVLTVARNGAKKTKIMYQANLSHKLLVHYLDHTIEAGLISISSGQGNYNLTPKGLKFLEDYDNFSKRRRELEEQLQMVKKEGLMLEEAYGIKTPNYRSRNASQTVSK